MLVLALDTSSAAVSVAVVEVSAGADPSTLAARSVESRGHGEQLAPTIAACLADLGRTPRELGAIVAGLGPGPFTGLRVGLVTAGALADALGVPVYGVCSLDGLAHASDGDLLVAIDARRKEVYWARYRGGERIAGPEVSKPADVALDGATEMTGAGARVYADVLGLPLLAVEHADPARLVDRALDRIHDAAPSETLAPLYLRRPDAVPPAGVKTVTQ